MCDFPALVSTCLEDLLSCEVRKRRLFTVQAALKSLHDLSRMLFWIKVQTLRAVVCNPWFLGFFSVPTLAWLCLADTVHRLNVVRKYQEGRSCNSTIKTNVHVRLIILACLLTTKQHKDTAPLSQDQVCSYRPNQVKLTSGHCMWL